VCENEPLLISSREGIEIDHCARCRGVWLDRGELDKIIERAAPSVVGAGAAPPPPPPPPQRERDRDRYDRDRDEDRRRYERDRDDDRRRYERDDWERDRKRKKRKSFLEEIFDFD
jgi:Zn-finger nucleic acid-binding protein